MTGALVLAAALAALGTTGWLAAGLLRLDEPLPRLLAAYVLSAGWLVVACLGLSAVGGLSRWPLAGVLAGGALAATLVHRRAGRPGAPLGRLRDGLREAVADPIVAALAVVVALEVAYLLILSLAIPQADWDALIYHLPRAALWIQEGGVGWIDGADDPRINGFAPHAEIGMAATMALARSDRFVGLVQLASLLASCLAIALLARRLGLSRRAAAFGALVFATLPVAALQAPTALNDLAVAAPLLAATALALGTRRAELCLAAGATALAFGVKLTALVVAPLALLVVVVALPRGRRLAAVAAGAIGAAAGSYWYVVARAETGSIDGGVAAWQNQVPVRATADTTARVQSYVLSFLDAPGLVLADRWLFPVAGAALAAAALVRRRRGRAWAHLALAGGVVALLPAVVYVLGRGLERAFAEGWRAAGRDDLADAVARTLPSLGNPSPMSSWYGIAFVLLWAASIAPLTRAVRREGVSGGALVALGAPALYLPLFAVAFVDDGLRGRFFLFPVALAAATLGVVLARRWLAWSAVVAASLTALLCLVHFDDRPMGIRLLAPRQQPALWTAPRWQALTAHGRHGKDSPEVARALEEVVPAETTLAAAIGRDQYLYPVFDARLRRRVLLVAPGSPAPPDARWLVVGPGGHALVCPGAWAIASEPSAGWRILRRTGDGGCAAPLPA